MKTVNDILTKYPEAQIYPKISFTAKQLMAEIDMVLDYDETHVIELRTEDGELIFVYSINGSEIDIGVHRGECDYELDSTVSELFTNYELKTHYLFEKIEQQSNKIKRQLMGV